jgi:hypothetical protein
MAGNAAAISGSSLQPIDSGSDRSGQLAPMVWLGQRAVILMLRRLGGVAGRKENSQVGPKALR